MEQPIIETENLLLRSYTSTDSQMVAELAGDFRVAETTLNIPHPYHEQLAKDWISTHKYNWLNRKVISYAVILKNSSQLIGTVSLNSIVGEQAELGYWIAHDFWGKGYCTEAALALVNKAFKDFSISVINAEHLSSNPASGKVMSKIGMIKMHDVKKPNRDGMSCDVKIYRICSDKITLRTLHETGALKLQYEYEDVQLINKSSGKTIFSDEFYGDPQCGLIDEKNMWAIVAGNHLTIWRQGNYRKIISLKDIHSLRVKDSKTVEILIDPWAKHAAIWEINTQNFVLEKVREFTDYQGKEFTDNVIW